jgi:curved DNA-binding protein CbpA
VTGPAITESSRRRDLLLLGLGPAADGAAIRSAFRRLARSLHPDLHPTARPEQLESLRQRFVDVSAAYHRLAG